MQFNSFVFILLFLPLTVVLYFITNSVNVKLGKLIILVASIIFYGYADYKVFIILSLSLCINYLFTVFIVRGRDNNSTPLVVCPIVINILILLYFKYFNFAISNVNLLFSTNISLNKVILPLGISFFTFQQIAYVIAISRREIKDNNILDYIIYITYFPKILMGPLMDPVDFMEQLNDNDLKKINIETGVNKIWSFITCSYEGDDTRTVLYAYELDDNDEPAQYDLSTIDFGEDHR